MRILLRETHYGVTKQSHLFSPTNEFTLWRWKINERRHWLETVTAEARLQCNRGSRNTGWSILISEMCQKDNNLVRRQATQNLWRCLSGPEFWLKPIQSSLERPENVCPLTVTNPFDGPWERNARYPQIEFFYYSMRLSYNKMRKVRRSSFLHLLKPFHCTLYD